MKRIKLGIIFLVCFSFLFATGFDRKDFSIDVGKKYNTCYSSEIKSDFASRLNMTEDDLTSYFEKNNIRFLALSLDNKSQIRVSAEEDSFSKAVENMSSLSDNEISKLGQELLGDCISDFDIYKNDLYKYIKISERLKDSGGEYTLTRFITVEKGKLYSISFFGADTEMTKENYGILDSFKVNGEKKSNGNPWYVVFIVLGITVFASVIVIMLILTVRDYKRK